MRASISMNASSVGAHPHTYTHAHPTHVHARASCAPRKQTMRCGLSAIPSATARLTQNISLVGVPCCANAGCRLAVISRSPPPFGPSFLKKTRLPERSVHRFQQRGTASLVPARTGLSGVPTQGRATAWVDTYIPVRAPCAA